MTAKCELRSLMVGYLPLGVSGEDIDIVVMGFEMLGGFHNGRW